MLQFEELKRELHEKQAALEDLKDALGLERLREEVEMLENKACLLYTSPSPRDCS